VKLRAIALRCCYGAGVVAAIILALNLGSLMRDAMGMPETFASVIGPVAFVGVAVIGAPLVVLAFRPFWWGKLFVLAPAFSWAGFSAAMTFIAGWTPLLLIPMGCAGVMLGIAIIHQLLDPRFSGSPL
jgi:hypothetical protein